MRRKRRGKVRISALGSSTEALSPSSRKQNASSPCHTSRVDIWRNVNDLVDRAETVTALHAHRMHLYAAWRWRGLGRPVPDELVEGERGAALQRLGAPMLLRHVREAYEGPMVLLKGAEVAARYPKPQLRPSLDLDLLVPDAKAVQKALLAGGFTERRVYQPGEGHHHLRELEWPAVLMRVEVHSAPSWPTWLKPPPTEQLFEAAVPSPSSDTGFSRSLRHTTHSSSPRTCGARFLWSDSAS